MSRPVWYSDPALVGYSGHLKPAHASPLALADAIDKADEDSDTPSRAALRAMHALILEGEAAVSSSFVVSDVRRDKRTDAYQKVLAEAAGRSVLNAGEYSNALETAMRVRSYPWIARHLNRWTSDGWRMVVEVPMRWPESVPMTDPPAVVAAGVDPFADIEQVDVECKGIPDAVSIHAASRVGVAIDCKGVPTLRERALYAHLEKMLYHVQWGHYLAGLRASVPWVESWELYWLAYETRAPHDAALVRVSEEDVEYGADVRLRLIRRVIEVRRTGDATGRHPHIIESRLPAWETRDDNTTDEDGW